MYSTEGTRDRDFVSAVEWLKKLQHSNEEMASLEQLQDQPHVTIITRGTDIELFTEVNTVTLASFTYGTGHTRGFIGNWSNTIKRRADINLLGSLHEAKNADEIITIAELAGYDQIVVQLERLISFQDELEPDEARLSIDSLKQFIGFMLENNGIREPAFGLTDRGNIKAIWEFSEKQIFWIEFFPSGDVRYLAFVPNERRTDQVERTAGGSTVKDVLKRAKELGALPWIVK